MGKKHGETTKIHRKRKLKKRSYWWYFWRIWLFIIPALALVFWWRVKIITEEYHLGEQISNEYEMLYGIEEKFEDIKNGEQQEINDSTLNRISKFLCVYEREPYVPDMTIYCQINNLETGKIVHLTDSSKKWIFQAPIDSQGEEKQYRLYAADPQIPNDPELLAKINNSLPYPNLMHSQIPDYQIILHLLLDYQNFPVYYEKQQIKYAPYYLYIKVDDYYIDGIYENDSKSCIFGRYRIMKKYTDGSKPDEIVIELDDTPKHPEYYTHVIDDDEKMIAFYFGTSKDLPTYWDPLGDTINSDYPLDDIYSRAMDKGYTINTYCEYYGKYEVLCMIVSAAKWYEIQYIRITLEFIMIHYFVLFNIVIAVLAVWFYLIHLKKYRLQEQEEYRRTLTNTLAHDLKSPLMVISGYAENLTNGVHPEKSDYYAGQILEKTHYMNELIHNVLALSKLEEQSIRLPLEKIDAAAVIREHLMRHMDTLQKRKIQTELTDEAFIIHANPTMFERMVSNLVDNAIQHTPDSGEIQLIISEKKMLLRNTCPEDTTQSAEELAQPFVKGDQSRSGNHGTGIGLPIVLNLAKQQKLSCKLSIKDGFFIVSIS